MTACPWTTACSSHVATGGRCASTHRYTTRSTALFYTLCTVLVWVAQRTAETSPLQLSQDGILAKLAAAYVCAVALWATCPFALCRPAPPQDQAGRWIKAMELKNSLRVIRLGDPAAATASMARSLAPSLANNTTSPSAPSAPGTSPADASALAGNASTAAPSTLTSAGPASAAAPGAAGGSVSGAAAAGSGGGGVPLHLLEQCVRQGQPVLLEDVGEGPLDPVLEPLLTRATYTVGGCPRGRGVCRELLVTPLAPSLRGNFATRAKYR